MSNKIYSLQLIKYISIVTIVKILRSKYRNKIKISYNMITIIKELYKN